MQIAPAHISCARVMAIAGVLLLTASATYAVLKWRVLIPKFADTITDISQLGLPFTFQEGETIAKVIARPYISAIIAVITTLWAITFDASFDGKPSPVLVCSHIALFSAVVTIAFPRRIEWSISTTILSSAVAAYNVGRTTKGTLAAWVVLLAFNLISCIVNIYS